MAERKITAKPVSAALDINTKREITGQINDVVREKLMELQSNGKGKIKTTFAKQFVDNAFDLALKDPDSEMGKYLMKQIMRDDLLKILDDTTNKKLSKDVDFITFRLLKTLYHEQQTVFMDPVHKSICICSRRVGKTEMAARMLLADAIKPDHHAIFFSLKFENAIRQCYPIVRRLCDELEIPVVKDSRSEGEIALSNGSNILFKGNSNNMEADKNLGYHFSCVIVDECQNQKNLQYLLDTVIAPAQTDYPKDKRLILLGTPPRIPHTYCEKIWNEQKGWNKYTWDMEKNEFINPTHTEVEEYIKSICESKGCTTDAPFIQREMFGHWVWDKEAQVIKTPLLYSGIDELKQLIKDNKFHCDYVYGGIDWGGTDYNAIVSIAWDKNRKLGYVLPDYKFNQSTTTEIIEKCIHALEEAQDILSLSNAPLNNIMYYADHNIKSIVFELQKNYNFPIQLAYKHNKIEALGTLSDLLSTKIYTPKDSNLADEFDCVVYKRDEETDAILPELDEDLYHGDSIMAALYASRGLTGLENPMEEIGYKGDAELSPVKPDDEVDFTDEVQVG